MRIFICMVCCLFFAQSQASSLEFDHLADLSLEELMSIDISSVAEKAQLALNKASASYTIDREAIQRSGRRNPQVR